MNVDFIKSVLLSHVDTHFNNHDQYERKINMVHRYINFISSVKNTVNDIIENHHILPKSIWPEYKDLLINDWNSSLLTLRQHFIAHYMLYKIFGGKMTYALYQMVPQSFARYKGILKFNDRINSSLYEEVCTDVKAERAGFGTYRDDNGNTYFLHRDDPQIKDMNLVWNLLGYRPTRKQIEHGLSRRNKGRGTKIKMYFMRNTTYIFRDEYDKYRYQGWSSYKTKEDLIDINKHNNIVKYNGAIILREKYKGQKLRYDKDGNCYGYMFDGNPDIELYELIDSKNSPKQVKQRVERSRLAVIANTDTVVYNNRTIQMKYKHGDSIPDGFVKGGLPRKLVKGHEVKYEWKNKEKHDEMINLIKHHNGSLSSVGEILNISATNILKNIRKYIPDFDHTQYRPPIYKYQNDKSYKLEIDRMYPNVFDRIKFLDIDEYNKVVEMRNTILSSGINLTINGWISNIVTLLNSNRKSVVSFTKTYMSDINIYWRVSPS